MQKHFIKTDALKIAIIVLISFLIGVIAISFFILYRDTIYNGIEIEGVDVSGLSIVEARKKLEKQFDNEQSAKKIQFVYGTKTWDISIQEIDYSYDYTKALQEAYETGRKGNYFHRLAKVLSLYREPHTIQLEPIYDAGKLDAVLEKLRGEIEQPPKDARISRQGGKFVIQEEQIGLQLDVKKLKSLLEKDISKLKYAEEVQLDIPVEVVSPKITAESLSVIEDLLGKYTTKFSTSNYNRVQNIRLAAKAIDGTVLLPGEVFSFNDVVGPRTKDRGYQDAPVIFEGEFVDGLGGGVCQVSSTLYNAALLSGLKIVERIKHSIPSTYVPKGRDATVSYGIIDFKFENNLSHPIYLEAYISGNSLNVCVYGKKTTNQTIQIHSVENEVVKRDVEVKYDPKLPEGQERIEQKGRDGYKVTTYKIIYENGVEVRREKVSTDYYKPQKQIIVKGTKKVTANTPAFSQDTNQNTVHESVPASND